MRTIIYALVILSISGCLLNPHSKNSLHRTKRIVCTTTIIASCIREILPSSYNIHTLMGPNVDPHGYNTRPSDMIALKNSALILNNGFHLEGKMTDVFTILEKNHIVLSASDYFESKTTNHLDPHIWFSVPEWLESMHQMCIQIADIYPEDRQIIETRFKKFKFKTMKTYLFWKQKFTEIPKPQRVLITSHDAFNYFGTSFEIEVRAIQGLSTVHETGIKAFSELLNFVVSRKIKAVFPESSVSPKTIQALVEQSTINGHNLSLGKELYSDALGGSNSGASTYSGMIKANCESIYNALKQRQKNAQNP